MSLPGDKALELLQQLIETPSLSREEDKTAELLEKSLKENGVEPFRSGNNVWAFNKNYDPSKPTILLNSHHDTVKPNAGYTRDPFKATIEEGKLYGLGSNDAGGALCSMLETFVKFYGKEAPAYNLCFAGTAEEEISGRNGVESILKELGDIWLAFVGEPTLLDVAVSEKGLMVLDGVVTGVAGHAAREEGDNAIYKALSDVSWFKEFRFPEVSETLGPMKMNLTVLNSGTQHNVVPDKCTYVVDIRLTDSYTHEETLEIIRANVQAEVTPRSTRLRPSSLPKDHSFWNVIDALNLKTYGSPTMSDQALMPFTSVKIGPGDSARSHTADEYIYVDEIRKGVECYSAILEKLL